MHRGGREVCSRTNYILVKDRWLLQNVAVRDAWYNTYHYLVLGCLHGAALTTHSLYLGKQTRFPIKPPPTPNGVDHVFADLQEAITKPRCQERLHQAWISP